MNAITADTLEVRREDRVPGGLVVYSTPSCVQCKATYRALDDRGIRYRVVDLTQSEAALVYVTEELGYSAAPVVVVSDADHWSGFRPDHIGRLAGLLGAGRQAVRS